MPPLSSPAHSERSRLGHSLICFTAAALIATSAHIAQAQNATQQAAPRTLEVPTLVLTSDPKPLPLVDPSKVSVTIDKMRSFHPEHVRLQGDDPITLAILVDVSGSAKHLIQTLQQDLPTWAATSLTSRDQISIYAVDCAIAHPAGYAPPNAAQLSTALNAAIASPYIHGKTQTGCSSSFQFRDALNLISQQMAHLTGRKVILAITNGYDSGSYIKSPELLMQLKARYVSVFGFTDADPSSFLSLLFFSPLTGGTLIQTSRKQLTGDLDKFIEMLRGRYIIDFPEPANLSDGPHHIDVRIANRGARWIIPAGLQVAMDSPSTKVQQPDASQ